MQRAVRNLGREGLAATAISAVDAAIYDLKARLLDVPLFIMLGSYRDAVTIYGSGGFTTYSRRRASEQLGDWVARDGCAFVKMKVGSQPDARPRRVAVAKQPSAKTRFCLSMPTALSRATGAEFATQFAEQQVGWFEEPVSSDDLPGLRAIRSGPRPDGYRSRRICLHGRLCPRHAARRSAVDVQQADVTRCGGITAFLQIAALCEAFHIDLSGHCAPALHLHVACASPDCEISSGFTIMSGSSTCFSTGRRCPPRTAIRPDLSRPGNGLTSNIRMRRVTPSRAHEKANNQVVLSEAGLALAGLALGSVVLPRRLRVSGNVGAFAPLLPSEIARVTCPPR